MTGIRIDALALVALLLGLALAGCAAGPQAGVLPGEAVVVPPARGVDRRASFEDRQRERAQSLVHQGRLADAALAWEVLLVLRPDATDYRERLAETRREIDAAAADRLARAAQAQKRGQLDTAAQQYLAALALQPDNAAAADALRSIERERNKRNYLGKFSRITLSRRAIADAEIPASGPAGLSLPDRNEIEHASMLATEGEYDEAIRLLERRLGGSRGEPATRHMLSQVYLQKGQALARQNDVPGAIKALERSVQYDPGNAGAQAQLKRIRSAAVRASAAPASSADAAPRRQ